jgi:hypothetical protein
MRRMKLPAYHKAPLSQLPRPLKTFIRGFASMILSYRRTIAGLDFAIFTDYLHTSVIARGYRNDLPNYL